MPFLEGEFLETSEVPRLLRGSIKERDPGVSISLGAHVDPFPGAAIALGAHECSCVKPLIHTAIIPNPPDHVSGGDMGPLERGRPRILRIAILRTVTGSPDVS